MAKHLQEGMAFSIHQALSVHMSSRVFFVLPDAGVTIDSLRTVTGRAPNPSWWVLCDVGGRGSNLGANSPASKRRMPVFVPELLGNVKQWAGAARRVIVIGFLAAALGDWTWSYSMPQTWTLQF